MIKAIEGIILIHLLYLSQILVNCDDAKSYIKSKVIYQLPNFTYYFSSDRWIYDNTIINTTSSSDIIQYCNLKYRNRNFTSILPEFHKISVANSHQLQPFICVDDQYNPPAITLPKYCVLRSFPSDDGKCFSVNFWKNKAHQTCSNENQYLKILQMGLPCPLDLARFAQFLCCYANDDSEKYEVIVAKYRANVKKSPEHDFFSVTKQDLLNLYLNIKKAHYQVANQEMGQLLPSDVKQKRPETIIKLKGIENTFIQNLKNATHVFTKNLHNIGRTHFNRIFHQKIWCYQKKISNQQADCNRAVKRWAMHCVKMCKFKLILDYTQYIQFCRKHLSKFVKANQLDTNLQKEFEGVISRHKISQCSVSKNIKLTKYINEAYQSLYQKHFVSHSHTNSIHQSMKYKFRVFATITLPILVCLLILLILFAFVKLTPYQRSWFHSLRHRHRRRSSPRHNNNCVITTVVTDPNDSNGTSLNLYENPGFNNNTNSGNMGNKKTEKRSLIENMDE